MVRGTLHGIARYSYCLIEGLARLRPDWTVGVWTNQAEVWEPLRQRSPNLVPWAVQARPFSLREQWELPLSAHRFRPDLVHFCSIAVPFFMPAPFLISVHDLIPYHFSSSRLARAYLSVVFRHLAGRATRIVCGSRFSERDIESILGITSEHVSVVPYGGLDGPATPKLDARPLPPTDQTRPYFLCVTNPKPSKNLGMLLEAFRPLEGDCDLVVVSPSAPWLEERLQGRPAIRRIHGITDEALRGVLEAGSGLALAVVIPSLYEGFGIPPLEAMQLGTAVISSNATSLPEVVGEAGLLFDPRKPTELTELLRRVADSPELRADLVARGTRQAALFSWEACVQGHIQVYEDALGRANRHVGLEY